MDPDADAIAYLQARGAGEVAHPGGTLLAHLRRTAALLQSWEVRPELITAGLCHALYGTDSFPVALAGPGALPRSGSHLLPPLAREAVS